MENVIIFCEGVSDQRFLRDFIYLNYQFEITDKDLKANKYIHCLQGWANLKNLKHLIEELYTEKHSLIFLDADDHETPEKSGFVESNKYIDDLMKSWEWKNYDKYIFPNNKDEGEFEDFLEKIINTNNSSVFECWEGFENCLTAGYKNFNIPAKKSKIYLYHEVLHRNTIKEKDKCKDSGRDFKDTKLWDLDVKNNNYLIPLKTFLDKHLK